MRAPDDSLVQVGNPQFIIFGVVGKKMLVQHLGHVIDRTRVGRVEDFLFDMATFWQVDLDIQVALGDFHARGAIAINAHGA